VLGLGTERCGSTPYLVFDTLLPSFEVKVVIRRTRIGA
jgi:hypothetical protein